LTALEEAQRMGLIVSSAEGSAASFTFAHELVRQTLLADLALPRRQRLHLTVAAALERGHDSAVHECAGEIAHHLVQAGSLAETHRMVHYLTLAGRGALAAVAYDEALRHFAAALSYRDALDARQQTQLLKHLARAKRGLEDEAVDITMPCLTFLPASSDCEVIDGICTKSVPLGFPYQSFCQTRRNHELHKRVQPRFTLRAVKEAVGPP